MRLPVTCASSLELTDPTTTRPHPPASLVRSIGGSRTSEASRSGTGWAPHSEPRARRTFRQEGIQGFVGLRFDQAM